MGRWWNGVWGRLGRRDIWLSTSYRVTARQGHSDSKILQWDFDSEEAARDMVDRLRLADGPGEWREMDLGKTFGAPSDPMSKSG